MRRASPILMLTARTLEPAVGISLMAGQPPGICGATVFVYWAGRRFRFDPLKGLVCAFRGVPDGHVHAVGERFDGPWDLHALSRPRARVSVSSCGVPTRGRNARWLSPSNPGDLFTLVRFPRAFFSNPTVLIQMRDEASSGS